MKLPVPEPMLNYDQQTDRWSGANARFSIWMNDATFRAAAAVWSQWPVWLPELPHEEWVATAVSSCRRLDYWRDSERNDDPRIHLTYHEEPLLSVRRRKKPCLCGNG